MRSNTCQLHIFTYIFDLFQSIKLHFQLKLLTFLASEAIQRNTLLRTRRKKNARGYMKNVDVDVDIT